MVEFGRHLREHRKTLAMSRHDLARAAHVSERYIALIEGGKGNVSQIFKESLVETQRLRTEQSKAEARAAAQRRGDMQNFSHPFRTRLVTSSNVTSNSANLEQAAGNSR